MLALDDPLCPVKHETTPRQVAGGPVAENIFKCALKPLNFTDPGYGCRDIHHRSKEARLATVFPDGVCNWDVPGVGQAPVNPWNTFENGPGGRPLGPPPVSTPIRAASRGRYAGSDESSLPVYLDVSLWCRYWTLRS